MKPRERILTPTGAFRAWWSVAMIVLTVLLVAGAGVAYTSHVRREADRRWCRVLSMQANPDPPPATPRGWAQVREYQKLHRQFGCEDK